MTRQVCALFLCAAFACRNDTPAACPNPRVDTGGVANAECPVDECASSCDESAGVACCIAAHGRGLDKPATAALAAGCEGAACDARQYLSDATAVCIAQVYGLSPGIGACSADLQGCCGAEYEWQVDNTTRGSCGDSSVGFADGDVVWIDAITGAKPGQGGIQRDCW